MKGAIYIMGLLLAFVIYQPSLLANNGGGDDCVEICEEDQDTDLPKVFLIGQYSEEFETASEEYRLQLLEACNHDIDLAFGKWIDLLLKMEEYANMLEYDIKGVKMWIKVFWNEEGGIDHIAYYLKPKSRNISIDELSAFFMSFINHYQFPLTADDKFSHYGSAQFPILSPSRQ